MRPGRRSRKYLCEVQKGGRWLRPGLTFEVPYRDAVEAMFLYAEGACAKRARLTTGGLTVAEIVRPVFGLSRRWRWVRGGWSWSDA